MVIATINLIVFCVRDAILNLLCMLFHLIFTTKFLNKSKVTVLLHGRTKN